MKISLNRTMAVFVTIIAVISITPILTRTVYLPFYLICGVAIGIIGIQLLLSPQKITCYKKLLLAICMWSTIQIIYHFIGYSTSSLGNNYGTIKFYMIMIFGILICAYCKEQTRKLQFKILSIIIVINIIHNICLLSNNPNANTLIMTKGNEFLNTNIGGTGFIAMLFLFALIFLTIALNNKRYRIFAIGIYGLTTYLIIALYARATASILLIMFSLIIIIYKASLNVKKKGRFFFDIFLAIVFLGLSLILLNYFSGLSGNTRLFDRIAWLKMFFSKELTIGIIGDNSLSTRIYLILATFGTFISSPKNFLFGVGDRLATTGSISEMLQLTGVGYHSDLVDILGTNGIIGGFLLYYILFALYKKIMISGSSGKESGVFVKLIYLGFIVYSFFNRSFGGEIAVVVFLLLPSLSLIINENGEMREIK